MGKVCFVKHLENILSLLLEAAAAAALGEYYLGNIECPSQCQLFSSINGPLFYESVVI